MNKENIIGKSITKLRKTQKLTTKQLSEELKIKEKILIKWENGTLLPNIYQLNEIAEFFNIPIDELINGKQEEEKKSKIKKIIMILTIIIIQITVILITILITNNNNKLTIKNYEVNNNFIIIGQNNKRVKGDNCEGR